ncbi:predicted protein [Lichtheimia corymbifera JMRC:FSU:9682]|uniref:Uncharacterized protein n=1 Tax=Lichtheimia corymbifera JMRC:FSU:9682 TaxID=1263082 RepID=A0A068SH83_9FUNG|nr:predicted protein [Lichtheimia corymbifera JMRC:FSU:9682]
MSIRSQESASNRAGTPQERNATSPAPTTEMDLGSPVASVADDQSVITVPSNTSSSSLQRASHAIDRVTEKLARLAERLADEDLSSNDRQLIHQETQQASKDLDALKNVYRKMVKKDKSSSHSSRPVVPQVLPVLQWTNNVYDKSKLVFGSVEECLNRFEDVVVSYNQDMDEAWGRLLPRRTFKIT